MHEPVALLTIPDNGWLMPERSERALRELAPSHARLLTEGLNGAARTPIRRGCSRSPAGYT